MNDSLNNLPDNLNADLELSLEQTATDLGLENTAVEVGIVTPEGIFTGASGVADIETQTETTPDGLFNIGSISKSFTAATILKLQEDGKLNLDDTLGQWLPEIAAKIPGGENITLRQLLNGSSGIADYQGEEFLLDLAEVYLAGENKTWQPEEIFEYIAGEPLFSSQFSTDIWTYPNTGYVIAAAIAQQAAGKPFAEILDAEILQPLGLENTFFYTEEVDINRRVRGYEDIFNGKLELGQDGILEDYTPLNSSFAFGAGSMVANAEDVAIFFDALAGGELLQPESLTEQLNYTDTGIPEFDRFGMGVFPRSYAWGDVTSMTGGIFGYSSEVDYYGDRDTTVSVLVNQESPKAELTLTAHKAAMAKTLGWGNIVYLEDIQDEGEISSLDTPLTEEEIDIVVGSNNDDFVTGDRNDNVFFGEGGKDIISADAGNDFLNGGNNHDTLHGGDGDDSLIGGKGKDILYGEKGNDILDGGYGNDTLEDTQGDNTLYGNRGDDVLTTGKGNDRLEGEAGRDRLIARGGNDLLFGGDGNDFLNGGGGDDELTGGNDKDTLVGGAGVNYLTGGKGNDRFVLQTDGTSVINDFTSGEDLIKLRDGITYEDLEFIPGEEEGINYTQVNYGEDTLAILNNLSPENISLSDFQTANNNQSIFNFQFAEDIPQAVREGVIEAGEIWSNHLGDDVNLKLKIEYNSLGEFTAGEADSNTIEVSYTDFYQALSQDATSADDAIAVANLPQGDSIDLLINNTQENQGSNDPYLDNNGSANNSTISLTTANAKALGLDTGEEIDGTITFNSDVDLRDDIVWDFDRNDGIAENGLDFQAIAIHEIGHTLGFISGVDELDIIAGQNLGQIIASEDLTLADVTEVLGINDLVAEYGLLDLFSEIDLEELITGSPLEPIISEIEPDLFISEDNYIPTSMDLFRYSDNSTDLGIIDFTTGEAKKYISLDKGQTEIVQLSTGEYLGNGGQTSHWLPEEDIGIMQPGAGLGRIINISHNDLQLFDAIGWEVF